MHKFINNQIPSISGDLTERSDHNYPRNFSQSAFCLKRYSLNRTEYSISMWELNYGMMLLIKKRKILNLLLSFKKKKIISKLTETEN